MTAFVQAISRYRTTGTETETDILKIVALLCVAGMAVFFIRASYGLDLSPGFF
jgi:hypothetical protein